MTSSSNLLPLEGGQRLSFGDILKTISKDIEEDKWDLVDQTCENILVEANGNLDQIPFADLKYIQALAKFSTHHLVDAVEAALESFEANSNSSEVSSLLAILFALLGDLNKSLFYVKMAEAFPVREELKDLLPKNLPTLASAFKNVSEKPLLNKGVSSAANQDWYGAIHWFEQHIRYEPDNIDGYKALANIMSITGRFREAVDILCSGIHATSPEADTLSNIGSLLASLGEFDSAKNCHYLATKKAPDDIEINTDSLTDLFKYPDPNTSKIVEKCSQWMEKFSPELMPSDLSSLENKEKITVGYIIGPFGRRKPSQTFAEILAYRDEKKFSTVGFGYGVLTDRENVHFQKAFDIWHDTLDMDPFTLSSMIEAEEIDILIDMCGFGTPQLARVFGCRVAPVQVSWRGTPFGSGSDYVDYRISDAFSEEGIDESIYKEKVVHLEGSSLLINTPKLLNVDKIKDADTPLTFGANVSFSQLTGRTIATWAEILLEVPNSQLALWDHNFTLPINTDKLITLFGYHGVAHRIDILDVKDETEFFSNIDVHLFPFAPQTQYISADTVFNGIPVVCHKGDHYLERGMANVLTHAGVADSCVAQDREEYVSLAVNWADAAKRSEFHQSMYGKVNETTLFNVKERAKELGDTLTRIWEETVQRNK